MSSVFKSSFHRLLLITLFLLSGRAFGDEPHPQFSLISKDLEASVIEQGGMFGHDITLIRSALKNYDMHIVRAVDFGFTRTSAEQACKASHAHVCINASFFDERGLPLGLLVSRGITLQKTHMGGNVLSGIIGVTRDGPFISGRTDMPTGGMIEAIQTGPRLLLHGEPVSGVHEFESIRQSGVCIDNADRLVFYVVRSSLFALKLSDLLSTLKSPGVDCREVINLDGGGSSQLYISEKLIAEKEGVPPLSAPGKDSVPVFLALIPK